MEEIKVDKWEMYMEIQQLLKQGFSKVKVAKKLGISRTTVYRYIKRNPKSMSQWVENTSTRKKKLDDYKKHILSWIKEHPDMSAAQVINWLQEKYSGLEVAESTVRLYLRNLRIDYDIPKESAPRSYETVPEAPLGKQMQVDFGQTEQLTPEGKKVKLRFIAFVLANSRYKYQEWLDRPFTTRDVIQSHENAFRYFGGIPDELVYDQDALILVSENGGDLILTQEFQAYKEERELNIYMCRKADPESKGKIENVVKYIKQNFAKHRVYNGLSKWNEDAWKWLERTGNYKIHNTTKKRPVEVFAFEKQHLRPISSPIENYFDSNNTSSITRSVRKDNTIWYKSNRYSVPLGTFHQMKQVCIETTKSNYLLMADPRTGELIAKHKIEHCKGKLIQDDKHRRDRTKGIDTYIDTVASYFSHKDDATRYLQTIRKHRSRYIRDQLQKILEQLKLLDQYVIDVALEECMNKKMFSVTEFIDMVQYLNRQRGVTVTKEIKMNEAIEPIHSTSESVLHTEIHKRDVQEYVSMLEGDNL